MGLIDGMIGANLPAQTSSVQEAAGLANIAEARKVCLHLVEAGFPTMFVGGCVRDRLFGIAPKDFDLATAATPEQVTGVFEKIGYSVHPIGLGHGTVGIATGTQLVEVTTLREDLECDGRHARVQYTQSFAADARRRDFTINGLFEDLDGHIHDFVGGYDDLRDHHLRFIGNPSDRIREDYLRILRYFRFLARLGWKACPEAIQAINECRSGLKGIAKERILSEMDRLLTYPYASHALKNAGNCQVLATIFDWYQPEGLPEVLAKLPQLEAPQSETIWFIFLWHTSLENAPKPLEALLRTMRFSRARQRTIRLLFELFQAHDTPFPRLKILLRLLIDEQLSSGELIALLRCFPLHWPSKAMLMMEKLVAGASGTKPPIMRKDILSLPESERAEAVSIAKIFWYLGWCGGKTQLKFVLLRAAIFRSWLDNGATEPPPDTMWGDA